MRFALLFACTVAFTLGAAGPPAQAWTAQQNLAASLPIARAAWPNSQCSGREGVKITSKLTYLNTAGEADMDGSCRVRILPMRSPYKFCTVLVHEFGHLNEIVDPVTGEIRLDGRLVDEDGHTRDGGIMDPDGSWWDPCEKLGPPVTPQQAAADTFDLPASACVLARVTTTPRGRLYRCGRKQHVLVVLDRRGYVDYVTDPPPKRRPAGS